MARVELFVTYRDAVGVLLPDALGLGLALLKRVLVLELERIVVMVLWFVLMDLLR